MGFLDKITGKKEDKQKVSKKEENVLEMVQEQAPELETKVTVAPKENTGHAHRILKHHHLSEKTNLFSTTGRYVFKVANNANKIEVKKAVETVYDVHVVKVNMVNVPGKIRKSGRISGKTQDWKKAIVTLKSGEKISGLAEGI